MTDPATKPDKPTEQQVDEALEAAKGSKVYAAVLLAWPVVKLSGFLRDHPALKEKWADRIDIQVPNDTATLHRTLPPPIHPVVQDSSSRATIKDVTDEQISAAMAKEDDLFKKGLSVLCGGNDQRIELVMAMQRIARVHFSSTIAATYGGTFSNYLDLMLEKKSVLDKRLDPIRNAMADFANLPLGSDQRELVRKEEASLAAQVRELGAEMISIAKVMYSSAMVQAQMRGRDRKNKKLGFKQKAAAEQPPAKPTEG